MVTVTEVLFGQKDKLEGEEEGVEEEEQEGEQDPVQQDDVKTPLSQTDQYSPVQIPDFGEPHPGPTRRFPNVNTARERDFFDLLFTNDIWEILVQETNRYYDQQKATDPGKHKKTLGSCHER